ncbi:MAG: ATP-dependent DNA helicase RecG [Planctomycetaceae bacterium]
MSEPSLQTALQYVRGVGPHRAELLARLGLSSVADLLFYLPHSILDLTHVSAVSELKPDELQSVRGRVVDLDGRELAGGKSISAVLLDCDAGLLRGVWFNQTWVLQKFQRDQLVLFSGKPRRKAGRWEMPHPRIQWLDADDTEAHGGILPRYGLTEGLAMYEMRRLIRNAVEDFAHLVPEHLPPEFRRAQGLLPVVDALRQIHAPESAEQFAAGRRRLIFEDLLELQLGVALRRRAWRAGKSAPRIPVTAKIDSRIRRLFPFQLTAGQNQAVREIAADLDSGTAMHRLLQADVGAGKTVVAVYAMLAAVAAGWQTALMAPTEVLATQHWDTIDRLLRHSRVNRLLLTGQLNSAARREALAAIQAGDVQLVVGTQALIQHDVQFSRLGLAVIDEQHKFGVAQRASFAASGAPPHTLVMTATPIPRSLCLTQFGDLDLTIITDQPPGRQRVVTSRVASGAVRDKAWEFIREKLRSGRQAYVICPRIGSDGEVQDDPAAAGQVFQALGQRELAGFRLGLVHGRLEARDKAAAMQAFRNGEMQVLVATTVVEVGVDVPNATLMAILQAESFGLSPLHQLRGRISRGSFPGYCFLFSDAADPDAVTRLTTLERHASGFEVAEADFALRGPGDVLGTRQHGDLPLAVADLVRDQAELAAAREAAFALVRSGEFDEPQFAPLKARVLERFGKLFEVAGSG